MCALFIAKVEVEEAKEKRLADAEQKLSSMEQEIEEIREEVSLA